MPCDKLIGWNVKVRGTAIGSLHVWNDDPMKAFA